MLWYFNSDLVLLFCFPEDGLASSLLIVSLSCVEFFNLEDGRASPFLIVPS